jgi:hypothetical protein
MASWNYFVVILRYLLCVCNADTEIQGLDTEYLKKADRFFKRMQRRSLLMGGSDTEHPAVALIGNNDESDDDDYNNI